MLLLCRLLNFFLNYITQRINKNILCVDRVLTYYYLGYVTCTLLFCLLIAYCGCGSLENQ